MEHTVEEALDILSNLGFESIQNLDYIKAIIYYERYIALNPSNANIYNSLGYAYKKLGGKYQNLDLQIENFEKALELDSEHDLALRNLALTYPIVGRYQEALNCFRKLFEIAPVMDDYVTYAYQNIQLGNFEEGWKYLEYRFTKKYMPTKYPNFSKPRWDGQKMPDKILLVQYEQGFGDSIQFCRYLEQVKPLVKKIIFRVQDELVDLMKLNLIDVEVVGVSTSLDELEFDYHVPLISLLHVMNARIDDIPFSGGYIKADDSKIEKYKKRFFDNDCFKIGISWNGTQLGNVSRDIPLSCFYPLTKMKKVKVYSFQKGFGAKQMTELPTDVEIVDLGATFNDFSDTAAAMANLDLFITSDNSVFNLAGSMNKKTFVLLNKFSEWRWFFDEDKMPWYDCVDIFKKQNEFDEWEVLFNRVVERLNSDYIK